MSLKNLNDIKLEENFIRDNLYNPKYEDHEMSLSPYYNLIKINKETWNFICCAITQLDEDSTLYFPKARTKLRKYIGRPWEEIEKIAKGNDIEKYFGDNADNVYIAGGAALSILLSSECKDTDYFATKEIYPWEIKSTNFKVTNHVINFSNKKQLIKRLYKQPHEILHSFDIDSCAILVNRHGEIYASQRFISALINGYNTVDFNYLSPSYEWRLIKYSGRGFGVKVEGIENGDNIRNVEMKNSDNQYVPDYIWGYADIQDILASSLSRALLINAKGMNKILLASFMSRNKTTNQNIKNIAESQASDYESDVVYTKNKITGAIIIDDIKYIIDGSINISEDGKGEYEGYINKKSDSKNNSEYLEFSDDLNKKIMSILISEYKKVNPGEQATSTFNQIVLDNPDVWYELNIKDLFINSLYTFLNFPRVHHLPSLYDDKVKWFSKDILDEYVYHIVRLIYNNKIYDKFGDFTLSTFRVSNNDIRPDVLSYGSDSVQLKRGNTKDIIDAMYNSQLLSEVDMNLLRKLSMRLESSEMMENMARSGRYRSTHNEPNYTVSNSIPRVEHRIQETNLSQ